MTVEDSMWARLFKRYGNLTVYSTAGGARVVITFGGGPDAQLGAGQTMGEALREALAKAGV